MVMDILIAHCDPFLYVPHWKQHWRKGMKSWLFHQSPWLHCACMMVIVKIDRGELCYVQNNRWKKNTIVLEIKSLVPLPVLNKLRSKTISFHNITQTSLKIRPCNTHTNSTCSVYWAILLNFDYFILSWNMVFSKHK